MKLNEKIYEYRKINRWSQEDLADKLEVSRQTISKWEVGKNVPELDKLIKLAELFNITVDDLVKDEKDIVTNSNENIYVNENNEFIIKKEIDEENTNKKSCIKDLFIKIKKGQLIKFFIILIIIMLVIVLYKNIVNKVELLKREDDIKEIAQVYKDNFKTIGWSESALISEKISTRENNVVKEIFREYYVYAEEGKRLIKAKEYDGKNRNKLKKEIYIDLSKQVSSDFMTNICKYDGVTEVYINDWSTKVINDYEFIFPIDRISMALEDRYFDLVGNSESIALDKNNNIFVLKLPNHNTRNYGWNYGIKNNPDREDVLDLYISNERFLNLYFDNYKNDISDSREIIDITITKQKGCIDDVTVPEL